MSQPARLVEVRQPAEFAGLLDVVGIVRPDEAEDERHRDNDGRNDDFLDLAQAPVRLQAPSDIDQDEATADEGEGGKGRGLGQRGESTGGRRGDGDPRRSIAQIDHQQRQRQAGKEQGAGLHHERPAPVQVQRRCQEQDGGSEERDAPEPSGAQQDAQRPQRGEVEREADDAAGAIERQPGHGQQGDDPLVKSEIRRGWTTARPAPGFHRRATARRAAASRPSDRRLRLPERMQIGERLPEPHEQHVQGIKHRRGEAGPQDVDQRACRSTLGRK